MPGKPEFSAFVVPPVVAFMVAWALQSWDLSTWEALAIGALLGGAFTLVVAYFAFNREADDEP